MNTTARTAEPSLRRLTIGQAFFLSIAAVVLVVAAGSAAFLQHSRGAILAASERLRESAARRVENEVATSLGGAEKALDATLRLVQSGGVSVTDLSALEGALLAELTSAPHLAEVTLTGGRFRGYDGEGEALLDGEGRFQLSVFRTAEGRTSSRLVRDGDGFVSTSREHANDRDFRSVPFAAGGPANDPTAHPTYTVAAAARNQGRSLWSDLHYSELDAGRADPRVVLSVQKAVKSPESGMLCVVRVALLTGDLDAIVRARPEGVAAEDPHRVALLSVSDDGVARLVARTSDQDRVQAFGEELRILPHSPPAWLDALLKSALVRGLNPEHPAARGELRVGGEPYLATLRELSKTGGGTAGWLVAVVVPQAHYTAELVRFEHGFLIVFAVTLAVVLAIGVITLGAIRRGLAEVVATTGRMRRFDFASGSGRSRLREIDDVMLGLERAKTVARAMGKYVPLDLVGRLYERNREPELGGELAELTLLFTDIEGFTSLSERLAPGALAERLGEYLEVVTSAVQGTSGTIDKYIGDAVMAFWNAPAAVEDHAIRACEAVLECKRATAELYASPSWAGLPSLTTRYGVHSASVLVGNFGARSRLSYTALGDGVNLAARLEPLCKQYGVTVLVSETVAAAARDAFEFRRIDRVAVKGKTQGIDVYELLGRSGEGVVPRHAAEYERAFAAYLDLDFAGALAILESQLDDPPSAVLAERCRAYFRAPPPADWNRVHVASAK